MSHSQLPPGDDSDDVFDDDDGLVMFSVREFDVEVNNRTHQITFRVDLASFPSRDAFRAAKDAFRAALKAKLPAGPWTITQEPSL